jgi:hypothetical protein
MKYPETIKQFYNFIQILPDIERLLASIYQQSVCLRSGVFSESIRMQRLKEFYALIENLKQTKHAIAVFSHVRDNFKSEHLRSLVRYTTEEEPAGLFPDIDSSVGEFEALVTWQSVGY